MYTFSLELYGPLRSSALSVLVAVVLLSSLIAEGDSLPMSAVVIGVIPSSCTDIDTGTDTATKTDREVPGTNTATDTNIESVRTCRRTGLNSGTLAARRSRLGLRTDTCIRMWCRFLYF